MSDSDTDDVPAYLPVAIAVLSALFGAIGGGALAWWAHGEVEIPEADSVEVEVVRDYTDEELQIACLQFMRQTATTLEEAETRVEALAVQVRAKEAQIAKLEQEVQGESADKRKLQSKLSAARSELSGLEGALAEAEAERLRLELELEETKETLSVTRTRLVSEKARTQRAQEDALGSRWTRFQADSQLTICEKGSKTRIEKCRDTVGSLLVAQEKRFKTCVRSGQAVPALLFDDGKSGLPRFAVHLDERDRDAKGWYIEFCDPELPEAGSSRPPVTAPPDGHEP